MEEFTSTEFALARNFGFDITMPDSSMGLAGALHQAYIDRCQALYREFITNMTSHIKAEKDMKKVLGDIHTERMNNMRYSLYCSQNNELDPFTRRQPEPSVSPLQTESRGNTPWGLDVIPDEDEDDMNEKVSKRPKTAQFLDSRSEHTPSHSFNRPKTGIPKVSKEGGNVTEAADDSENVTKQTIIGLVDLESERSSARKITVGQNSFNKLGRTEVYAKLKNKQGRYLMRPLNVQYDGKNAETSATTAYDPSKRKLAFDPVNEKVALVRRLTTFQSPTISSDLKINNRVPIQKNLKGIDAKRITVSEIFQNARDRQTRHFRIIKFRNISSEPALTESSGSKLALSNNHPSSRLSDRRDVDTRDQMHSMTSFIASRPDKASSALGHHGVDEPDLGSSYGSQQQQPRSILHSSHPEGEGGRARAGTATSDLNLDASFRRSGSRVAFARSDSQLSHHAFNISRETPDLAAHLNSQYGSAKRPGNVSYSPGYGDGPDPQADFIDQVVQVNTSTCVPSGGKSSRKHSGMERPESSLSFTSPKKPDYRTNTDYIVKKQKEMDEQLNAQMSVWRRRMGAKSSAAKSAKRAQPGKGIKLRII